MLRSLLFSFLVTCCFARLTALDRSAAESGMPPNPIFKRLTINEGLSQNTVFCSMQDSDGFIWMGTEDGLNKYDGYQFTIYKHENSNPASLSHSQINAITEDQRGNLWIGTSDGLNLFDRNTEKFTRINTLHKNYPDSRDLITSLLCDRQGNLWIGSSHGLKKYDYEQGTVILYPIPDSAHTHNSVNRVQTIFQDKQDKLWISIGNDLRHFDPVRKRWLPLPAEIAGNPLLRKSHIRAIRQSPSGTYWFGTENAGLFRYDPQNQQLTRYKHVPGEQHMLPVNVIRELFCYSDDEIWIGTRDGLSILHVKKNHFTNYRYNRFDPHSLSHNSVRSIMRDRTGNIWIGTYAGGVSLYFENSSNFAHIGEKVDRRAGLTHRVVSSIRKDRSGGLWIGTEGGGLNYLNRRLNTTRNYTIGGRQNNIVKCLAMDSLENLWIGTYNGVSYLETSTGKLTDFPIPDDDLKPENKLVHSLAAGNKGVWIGTDGRGLRFMGRDGKITTHMNQRDNPHSIGGNIVFSILQDQGHLWVGTEGGLNHYTEKENRFTRYRYESNNPYSLSHNSVLSLFKDSQGRLWIGTDGGGLNLYHEKTHRFAALTTHNGLANNVIHSIQEDSQGCLWVSSNKGLSRIKVNHTGIPFSEDMFEITNYTVADGLQSNQFLMGSAERGDDGELLFGGINGVTTFFPAQMKSNTYRPPVVITELLIKNNHVVAGQPNSPLEKSIHQTEKITLTYDQAFITFRFAALNYLNPENNQYAYKLEGFPDGDWHYVGNQRSATYTNLNPGEYRFLLKASNNDGIWNEVPKAVLITVLPPWWKTWWAYLAYLIVTAAVLFIYYYYSIKTAKLKNALAFEQLSHEKDQQVAQRKLSFFTNISHEIKTPLTLILSPIQQLLSMNNGNHRMEGQLLMMQRNGERLVRLINQLLDFRKFESGIMKLQAAETDLIPFTREIIAAFEPYARRRNIRLSFKAEQASLHLWFDADKLEKVLYNLLSNAIKFTKADGSVVVSIRNCDGHHACITVEDNGIGIDEGHIAYIFEQFSNFRTEGDDYVEGTGIGLAFSKGLVELHHGTITVNSRRETPQEKGSTRFEVMLPIGSGHLSADEIVHTARADYEIETGNQLQLPVSIRESLENKKQYLLNANKEKLLLLIVEDNDDVRQFIASHFEENFEVHTASNGSEGWEAAIQTIPDIIISDVMMPLMNGITLCSKIKADSQTSHIPVILLTARTPHIYKIEGFETGADDYITKPFHADVLESRVWNLLDSRQKLRERYRQEISLQPQDISLSSPDQQFLNKVMDFIERNMMEPSLSVEELGKEVGISRVTLYRKIKALTNQTAIEFIRTIRLKRAAQLLEKNNYNVSEVAYIVGFSDIDYFRRCFKEQFGHTPKEYAAANSVKQHVTI